MLISNNFNIFEENKNNYENENDNDNKNGIDLVINSNNNDIIIEDNKNNIPDNSQNEFELEDIPELDQQTNENRAINNNNNFNDNNNNNNNIDIKISFNNKSNKSNDNMNQDENFKLDEDEIELAENSIDREAENNKLLEEERLRKEKEEEEERIRKEKEESSITSLPFSLYSFSLCAFVCNIQLFHQLLHWIILISLGPQYLSLSYLQ